MGAVLLGVVMVFGEAGAGTGLGEGFGAGDAVETVFAVLVGFDERPTFGNRSGVPVAIVTAKSVVEVCSMSVEGEVVAVPSPTFIELAF